MTDLRREAPAPSSRRPWYRDKKARDRVTLWLFGILGIGGILLAGSLRLARGDERVLVVSMERTAGQADRELLKRDCGSLPGISVVPDQGNPDPRVQGRFPVRFRIGGTTARQAAALYACVDRHDDIVRGAQEEGV